MKRRKLLLSGTLVLSLVYSCIMIMALVKPAERATVLQKNTLYWLQAGVFKKTSSYASLKETVSTLGFHVHEVYVDELIYLVIEVSIDKDEVLDAMSVLSDHQIEVILKHSELSAEQKKKVDEGQIDAVLTEVMS